MLADGWRQKWACETFSLHWQIVEEKLDAFEAPIELLLSV